MLLTKASCWGTLELLLVPPSSLTDLLDREASGEDTKDSSGFSDDGAYILSKYKRLGSVLTNSWTGISSSQLQARTHLSTTGQRDVTLVWEPVAVVPVPPGGFFFVEISITDGTIQ